MELISYASDFVSFLIQNTKNIEKIKSIILFGSSARGEATKESDVDIFIDILDNEKLMEKEAKEISSKFFNSVKFKSYWKLLNIKNEISTIVGKLNEWKLKDSMLGSSIVLYQKYSPTLENGRNIAILTWSNVKPNSRRVMLNKKLFGYKHYKRYYKGILEQHESKKLGTNVISIPTEHLNLFIKEFHKFKIPVKIQRVFEYKD
ncbi:MAG: nucleotidyltransferase domain-containing protein [Nanoarchaeota archaeon]